MSAGPRIDQTLPILRPAARDAAPVPVPELDLAGRTHVGNVRERNEDQFLIAYLGRWLNIVASSIGESPRELTKLQGALFVVADGMGGMGGGDVASAVALDSFVQHSLIEMPWIAAGSPEGDALLAKDVSAFVVACQARLTTIAERKNLPRKLGTTLTAAYLQGTRLIIAHVGDTRAYLCRAGALTQLTRDHTLSDALGGSTKNPAFDHVLVNAIGGDAQAPLADLSVIDLLAGDAVMLCSDGLHGPVPNARMAEIIAAARTSAEAADALVAEALAAGGPDNVTVVVARG